MQQINDYDFSGQNVLVRVDFNVPLDEHKNVSDNTRIQAASKTINTIADKGGNVILVSHLGRPKGQKNQEFSLQPIVKEVEKVLGRPVQFVDDTVGEKVASKIKEMQPGDILLLENVRFYPGEEAGDDAFAKQLAENMDAYVNDAFGTAHRKHASTAVVGDYIPNKMFGYLMEQELEAIDKVLASGEKPVTAILGGAKVSSKITIIENILSAVDNLIIGGGMAYTFVKAQGGSIGNSLVEDDKLDLALSILEEAKKKNVQVYLPEDTVAADDFSNEANTQMVPTNAIPEGWEGVDIGNKTREQFAEVIENSKTVLWNGPMGVFEMPNFAKGTEAVGDAVAKATEKGAFTLVGGGDSVAFAKQYGYDSKVSYVSTGGGAMLESLEGKELPGVASIKNTK